MGGNKGAIMWIFPQSIISAFAADTEASTSDFAGASRACEQSLIVRSKPRRSRFFLQEWRNGNLMRLRSGVISKPSLGKVLLEKWTSSLADTHANRFQQTESDKVKRTNAISGRVSQEEFLFCAQDSASLRMLKDTLPSGCATFCGTWESWVTDRHGEYFRRENAAALISEDESSYWPTIRASEWKGTGPLGSKSHNHRASLGYLDAVAQERTGQTGRLNPSWCEWLMGVPHGWTGCAYSETE